MTTDHLPETVLRDDPVLVSVVDEHGPITLEPYDDVFERLVRSIINQQLSTASATAIRERVYNAVEIDPDAILAVDAQSLRDAGLSKQKIGYVRNVAEYFNENGHNYETFASMTDDEIIEELTTIKGVGVWTVKMQLIFTFARPDVFPVEDLGIRNAIQQLYGDDVTREEMVALADRWRPYRSYASRYLWRAVD